jgi:hypothetical protein
MIEEGVAEAYHGLIFRGRKEKNEKPTATLAFGNFHLVHGTPFQPLTLPILYSP